MKKRKGILYVFIPVVMSICLYVVFYSEIESKPSDAGFWLLIVMGMTIGVALARLNLWFREKRNE